MAMKPRNESSRRVRKIGDGGIPGYRYRSASEPVLDRDGRLDERYLPPSLGVEEDTEIAIVRSYENMAEAVAETDLAAADSRYVLIGGPQGGLFTVDAAASGTADGGIVIDVNGGAQQLVRQYEGKPFNVLWFGAAGDGVADVTTNTPVWSSGFAASSQWKDATGVTVHTPV